MRFIIFAVATVFFSTLTMNASADPINFIDTGIGSGSLNSIAFSPSNFTINAAGDTSNVINQGSGNYLIFNSAASITINGLGTYSINENLTYTSIFVSNSLNMVGFQASGSDLCDLSSSSLTSWNMLSSIGTLYGSGPVNHIALQTDAGLLVFNYNSTPQPTTFSATVSASPTPIPAAAWLLGSGLLGLAGLRRRVRNNS